VGSFLPLSYYHRVANEPLLDIYLQHRTAHGKYTYFLMAVAASAVAFAIQKTNGLPLAWSHAPLGLSVIAFGVSFWCGAKTQMWVMAATRANYDMLQLERGLHEEQPLPGAYTDAATEATHQAMEHNTDKALTCEKWLHRTFITGGLAFVAWQVLQMHLTAIESC